MRKGRRAGVALQDLLVAQPIGSASETNKTAHTPLQDLIIAQPVGFTNETASSAQTPLQEILLAQRAVLIGLIAHIVGTTFEDDIARSADRLLRLGQDLLATTAARARANIRPPRPPNLAAAARRPVKAGRAFAATRRARP